MSACNINLLIGLTDALRRRENISAEEGQLLREWPLRSLDTADPRVVRTVVEKTSRYIECEIKDTLHAEELVTLFRRIGCLAPGNVTLRQSTDKALTRPRPEIRFKAQLFCFTGNFRDMTRQDCSDRVTALGGRVAVDVTKRLDYLVVGKYITGKSAHQVFGRKIERALRYREQGESVSIVSESHWNQSSNWLLAGMPVVNAQNTP